MIIKMTNKDDNFYNYMGKFFGSRIVQSETKDRIYDDNNKVWYIYLDNKSKPTSFISVHDNVIKNIYSCNKNHLEALLNDFNLNFGIQDSIVTNLYLDVYKACKLKIYNLDNYKNFVLIRGGNIEKD